MTKVIGVVSGKGGVGKTTVVTNLALALKEFGKKVTVVDCNLSTPHLTFYLGALRYKATINDALSGKIGIKSAVFHHDGIQFVPASLKLEDLTDVDIGKLKSCIRGLLDTGSDYIILDSAPGLGREAVSVLHASDEIIFVTTPFAAVINDVLRCQDVVTEFGKKDLSVVLNMVTKGRHEIRKESVEKITKLSVLSEIPFDKNILLSLALKQPVVKFRPNSASSVNLMKLAAGLAGEKYSPPKFRFLHEFYYRIRNTILPEPIVLPEKTEEIFSR